MILEKKTQRIRRILLIYPPWASVMKQSFEEIPLGIAYLSSYLRQFGYETCVYNADFLTPIYTFNHFSAYNHYSSYMDVMAHLSHPLWTNIQKRIQSLQPDLVGIHIKTPSYRSSTNIARLVKQWNPLVPVVVGGPHPSGIPLETAKNPYFDFVIKGEAEQTLQELVECLNVYDNPEKVKGLCFKQGNGSVLDTGPRPLLDDLDSLPFPDRENILDQEHYSSYAFGSIMGSRGCPFQCTYCDSWRVWTRKVRYRSSENLLGEVKLVYDRYNVRSIIFNDDTFTLHQKRAKKFCRLLIREGLKHLKWRCYTRADCVDEELAELMKAAGCDSTWVGLESGSPRILKVIKKAETIEEIEKGVKILRRAGLNVALFVMMGFQTETKEDVWETFQVAKRMKPYIITPSILTPHPGTEIYEQLAAEGKIPLNQTWESFFHQSPDMGLSTAMSPPEFTHTKKKWLAVISRYNAIEKARGIVRSCTTDTFPFVSRFFSMFLNEPSIQTKKITRTFSHLTRDILFHS